MITRIGGRRPVPLMDTPALLIDLEVIKRKSVAPPIVLVPPEESNLRHTV
jgi:hypothetical protein